MKAREILVLHDPADPRLSSVIVRFGGFHTLMSFLGAIGYIMDGSGLKEVFGEIYASNSIDKMLSGHAFSIAVRADKIVHAALSEIIFSSIDVTEEEKKFLDAALDCFNNPDADLAKMLNSDTLSSFKGKVMSHRA